jgi:ABC-2 type transport system ATP-binding protein
VEAEALADIIAIIYRGRILLQGSLDELKKQVLGVPEYEARFSHDWDAGEMEMPAGVTIANKTATSLKLRVERPQESNPQLVHALSAKSAPLVSFQEEPRTLEQVYLQVMADVRGDAHVG